MWSLWSWQAELLSHRWAAGMPMPGLSKSKACVNVRTKRQETRISSAWLGGLRTWRSFDRSHCWRLQLLFSRRHNCTGTSLSTVDTFYVVRIICKIMFFAFFNRTPTVFRLDGMKNPFLRFNEEFLTFHEVGLHFLKVGPLGGGLGAVEGLRKF